MGERIIDPKFNIHKTYKKVNITNPYRHQEGGSEEPSPFLVSQYLLIETSGNAIDTIGGHDGFVYDDIVRNGLSYTNESNGYVKIPDTNDHSFADENGDIPFEIQFQVYIPNISENGVVISKDGSSGNREWVIRNSNRRFQIILWENGTSNNFIDKGLHLSEDDQTSVWLDVKINYDGSKNRDGITFQVDGVNYDEVQLAGQTYNGMAQTTSSLTFFKTDNGSDYFKSSLKNIRIAKITE